MSGNGKSFLENLCSCGREQLPAPHLEQVENLLTQLVVKVPIRGVCHVIDEDKAVPLRLGTGRKGRVLHWRECGDPR